MKKSISSRKTGPDELRIIVSNLNVCLESFNEKFTAEQLLQIYRMLWKSDWDILPDEWTKRQIKEALQGMIPQWDFNLKPIYQKKNK